uniref:semaphorin-4A-like n=1 Tax=Pristiophorus japonicus TaxID=55135 RepID=UPI00398EFEAA
MRIGSHHTAMDSWLGLAIVGLTVLTGPAEGLGPRITFARGDSSRPLAQFSKEGYHNYSTLRLSADGKRLYVGARDVLFSFHLATLGTMELTKELHWKATEKKVQECSFKGKSKERDCFNFIRVVLPVNETHIYTCGTYAFSPTCAYIVRVTSLTFIA